MRHVIFHAALAALLSLGCTGGGGSGDGGGGSGGSGGSDMGVGSGAANEVDARVEGGSAAGEVQGESDESVEGQYYATVNEGRVQVYLAGASGVVFFDIDTETAAIPGSYTAGRELDGPAFLTLTTPTGIFESSGGTISVSGCPNEVGAQITGRFQGVGLFNVATESDDGTFEGEFAATVAVSDGSAQCDDGGMGGMGGMGGGGELSISPGPSCQNDTCDGACCPLLPAYVDCVIACQPQCMNPLDFQACIECFQACEQPLIDDPECGPAYTALNDCGQANMCEPGLEDNPCIADNCCDEFRSAF